MILLHYKQLKTQKFQRMNVVQQHPPQISKAGPVSSWQSAKFDDVERLNTFFSTQQTSRQQSHTPSHKQLQMPSKKSHITFVESSVQQLEDHQVVRPRLDFRGEGLKQEHYFKSQKNMEGEGSQVSGKSRSRRNKIFDKNYSFKSNNRTANELHNSTSHSAFRGNNRNGDVFCRVASPIKHFEPSVINESRPIPGGFIDNIRVVPNQRIIRVNSCNAFFTRPSPAVMNSPSANKVTFTYSKDPQPRFYQPQPQPQPIIQQQPLIQVYIPPQTKLLSPPALFISAPAFNYGSSTYLTSNTLLPTKETPKFEKNHTNPIANKIKKPNPTYRKATIIDEIKIYHLQNSQKDRAAPQIIGSKISLGNNIRESLVGGYSLATEKLRFNQSFSNIEEGNSKRYFDDDEEDVFTGEKISYKNIDIGNENDEIIEHIPEVNIQNIFSDFEHSRKHEHEKNQREKQAAPKQHRSSQPTHSLVLEKSTFESQPKKAQKESQVMFPLLLIGLATLLFLIQLAS